MKNIKTFLIALGFVLSTSIALFAFQPIGGGSSGIGHEPLRRSMLENCFICTPCCPTVCQYRIVCPVGNNECTPTACQAP